METRLRGGACLNTSRPLRLNVGFLLHKNVGYSRNFEFDHTSLQVGEDLEVARLHGVLSLTRTTQGLYLRGQLHAQVQLECVRCLNIFQQALTAEFDDLFVFPPERADDPLLIITETGFLDLCPLLREYLLLDIPIQPLCQPGCKGLCPVCGNNLNESICEHPEAEVDPRFAALKNLLSES